ncbi:DsbA family protein [Saccharibacillus sp. CPCC 101409]|uniref:DsbA family protein n=1 Tax=Saccharibacillus sp. CPCC 101409 TaxID=3058041 RepID=UPI0026738C4F|nr:DsbA family protein [Saccharibacillus sp. CPCC 101409]MDO3409981.1 DsbA family protein [Saccharibacillus sp. CPCC 101409]
MNNNRFCDLNTGVCGPAEEDSNGIVNFAPEAPKTTLYYVTDPICSHCWALEPVLSRFVHQYGQYFRLHIVMGGLLPSWHGFGDSANGIGKPADVAQHWREVGEHSRMPIDGGLWLDNPVQSSFPPSRVFKVIQHKHAGKEQEFLRKAREQLFAFNENIAEDRSLIRLVDQIGLDGAAVVEEASLEPAQDLLEEDFALAARLGVRGFPTIAIVNEENRGVKIVGARPLEAYVKGLEEVLQKTPIAADLPEFGEWSSGGEKRFGKEIEVMYDLHPEQVEAFIASQPGSASERIRYVLGELYI